MPLLAHLHDPHPFIVVIQAPILLAGGGLRQQGLPEGRVRGQEEAPQEGRGAHIEVPYFDELSVKGLWPQFKKDAEMMAFFPDTYP